MKRYYIALLATTLVLTLLSIFAKIWFARESYLPVMSLMPLYFAVVTGLQHWAVVKAMDKSPRVFVQIFFGTFVGVGLLHVVVLFLYLLAYHVQVKLVGIAFCICIVVYLAFETTALVLFMNRQRKNTNTLNQ